MYADRCSCLCCSVHCHTWYRQFPRCLMDEFTLASLEHSVNFDFLFRKTWTLISRLFEHTPCHQKVVKPGLDGFLIKYITSKHFLIVLLHYNERICFCIPHNYLCLLLTSSHFPFCDYKATQWLEWQLQGHRIEFFGFLFCITQI